MNSSITSNVDMLYSNEETKIRDLFVTCSVPDLRKQGTISPYFVFWPDGVQGYPPWQACQVTEGRCLYIKVSP